MRTMDVSVIIPTFNGAKLLPSTLEALAGAIAIASIDCEVIVVDDASSDNTVDLLRERFPWTRTMVNQSNQGFAASVNKGVQGASGKYSLLLNNDMVLEADALARLMEVMVGGDDIFAVTARIIHQSRKRRWEETGLTSWFKRFGLIKVRHYPVLDDDIKEVLYAGGGSSLVNRDIYLKLNGFDPLYYPFYCEDTDISFRAWLKGYRTLFVPNAKAHHRHRGTIGRYFTPDYIRMIFYRNYYLFFWKNISDGKLIAEHKALHRLNWLRVGKNFSLYGYLGYKQALARYRELDEPKCESGGALSDIEVLKRTRIK